MTLKIEKVSKHFGIKNKILKAVDEVDLIIPPQSIFGLVGESGSGKSTLGRLILGLENKSSGEIFWQGEKMPNAFKSKDFQRYSQDIQMVFQDPYGSLNPRMTAIEIIAEPLLLAKKKSKDEIKTKAIEWLLKVGLREQMAGRYPHEFSGGQRQRLGIARALINQPKLLICDEPVSALDVSIQAQIVNLIKELQTELKMSVLFIAHDLAMVRYLSDEIAVMKSGKIVEQSAAEEIFSNPQHSYTKELLSANPSPDPDNPNFSI